MEKLPVKNTIFVKLNRYSRAFTEFITLFTCAAVIRVATGKGFEEAHRALGDRCIGSGVIEFGGSAHGQELWLDDGCRYLQIFAPNLYDFLLH